MHRYEQIGDRDAELQVFGSDSPAEVASAPQDAMNQPPSISQPSSQSFQQPQQPQPHQRPVEPLPQIRPPEGRPQIADGYEYEIRHTLVWDSARRIFQWRWLSFLALFLASLAITAATAGLHLLLKKHVSSLEKDPEVDEWFPRDENWLFMLLNFLIDILTGWVYWMFQCVMIAVSLEYLRGRRNVHFPDVFTVVFTQHVKQLTKLYVVKQFLVTLGLYLLLLPGLYLQLALFFLAPLALDRPSLSLRSSLSLSLTMVNRNLCGMLTYHLFLGLILLGGLLTCVVGVLPALCVLHIMSAVLYRDVFGLDSAYLQLRPVLEATPELGPCTGRFTTLLPVQVSSNGSAVVHHGGFEMQSSVVAGGQVVVQVPSSSTGSVTVISNAPISLPMVGVSPIVFSSSSSSSPSGLPMSIHGHHAVPAFSPSTHQPLHSQMYQQHQQQYQQQQFQQQLPQQHQMMGYAPSAPMSSSPMSSSMHSVQSQPGMMMSSPPAASFESEYSYPVQHPSTYDSSQHGPGGLHRNLSAPVMAASSTCPLDGGFSMQQQQQQNLDAYSPYQQQQQRLTRQPTRIPSALELRSQASQQQHIPSVPSTPFMSVSSSSSFALGPQQPSHALPPLPHNRRAHTLMPS